MQHWIAILGMALALAAGQAQACCKADGNTGIPSCDVANPTAEQQQQCIDAATDAVVATMNACERYSYYLAANNDQARVNFWTRACLAEKETDERQLEERRVRAQERAAAAAEQANRIEIQKLYTPLSEQTVPDEAHDGKEGK